MTASSLRTLPATMRAILQDRYGSADVLTLGEVPVPDPGEDEVLVRIRAAAVSVGDVHVLEGKPYLVRAFFGLTRPKHRTPGMDVAGTVERVGANVTEFQRGDEVYGEVDAGAFAEYGAFPASRLAGKPQNMTFEEAAALPWAATALTGLRDVGKLASGQRVLINGASGGVGTYAVQVAKSLGAHVTAVCSTRNVERMHALGADEVVDYSKEDFVARGPLHDVVFDLVGNHSVSEFRRALKPGGIYVSCGGDQGGDWLGPLGWVAAISIASLFGSRKMKSFVSTPRKEELLALKDLAERGALKTVVDKAFPLEAIPEALRYVARGHLQGRVVASIQGSAGAPAHPGDQSRSETPSDTKADFATLSPENAVP